MQMVGDMAWKEVKQLSNRKAWSNTEQTDIWIGVVKRDVWCVEFHDEKGFSIIYKSKSKSSAVRYAKQFMKKNPTIKPIHKRRYKNRR